MSEVNGTANGSVNRIKDKVAKPEAGSMAAVYAKMQELALKAKKKSCTLSSEAADGKGTMKLKSLPSLTAAAVVKAARANVDMNLTFEGAVEGKDAKVNGTWTGDAAEVMAETFLSVKEKEEE